MTKRQKYLCWFFVVLVGAIHACIHKDSVSADAVSYLDLGDAFVSGDWGRAVDLYWSPLYGYVLGVVNYVLKPNFENEFLLLHIVNFLIYVIAFAGFIFFIDQLLAYRSALDPSGRYMISDGWFGLLSYGLFAWISVKFIGLKSAGADQAVAAVACFSGGLLLVFARGTQAYWKYALFGFSLGVGYLFKAPMFFLSGILMFVALVITRDLKRVATSVLVFLVVVGPYVAAMSVKKGGFTTGEAWRTVYSGIVNRLNFDWSKTDPNAGQPINSPDTISESPKIRDYSKHLAGTYSYWSDPYYWYSGQRPYFNLRQQAARIIESMEFYYNLFFTHLALLVVALMVCAFLYSGIRDFWYTLKPFVFLMIAPFMSMLMFGLIYLEPRFIAGFVLVLLCAFFACFRVAGGAAPFPGKAIALAVSVLMLIKVAGLTLKDYRDRSSDDVDVARKLQVMGIRQGDKVSIFGNANEEQWTRLLKVKVSSEMHSCEVPKFLSLPEEKKKELYSKIISTGVKVIVSPDIPERSMPEGWKPLGVANYKAFFFN